MKLPEAHDLWSFNNYMEQLYVLAAELSQPHMHNLKVKSICERNLINLKKLSAIIMHLELATDEIMKVDLK